MCVSAELSEAQHRGSQLGCCSWRNRLGGHITPILLASPVGARLPTRPTPEVPRERERMLQTCKQVAIAVEGGDVKDAGTSRHTTQAPKCDCRGR